MKKMYDIGIKIYDISINRIITLVNLYKRGLISYDFDLDIISLRS